MSDLEELERERGNGEYLETKITKSSVQNHASVIAPAIMATFFSTVVAVIYCKVMGRRYD